MMDILLLLSVRFLLIIDRIEGDFAVIEWENYALSAIPLYLIPCKPKEGDHLYFVIFPTAIGTLTTTSNNLLIQTPKGPIAIPMPIELQHNTTYGIWIQCSQ